ncbi:Rrf2 family transcriptional regulator [Pedobacter sp. JY14-1]|uniref:RrF2 family transcriptional regulator n=1 Tax=Pedobacter sp. JY14-1 TaxID=3034151 RepID=UPI0023E2FF5F|nr:Rrf2 family transcriptional regulator [Pedobacter sp. JY14-1]
MNNTRFATAIHIMTLLAKSPDEWLSSDWIAGSININPVMVRKEIGILREAGLVESRKGKDGGCQLSRSAQAIFLSEIFSAVKTAELLGRKNQQPNPKCNIGKDINQRLNSLFNETDHIVSQFLGMKSLADFSAQFT